MRYCLLLALFLFQRSQAQFVFPHAVDMKTVKPLRIELKQKKPESFTSYTSFALKDIRPDTVTAGYVRVTHEYKSYYRLQIEGGATYMANYLNTFYDNRRKTDTARLVILLKNFFLTQEYEGTGLVRIFETRYVTKASVSARLLLQKGERYFHIGDVDTVLSIRKWLVKNYTGIAQSTLHYLVNRSEELWIDSELEEVSYDAFAATSRPPFFSISPLKDGLYRSYTDFLKQQPTGVVYPLTKQEEVGAKSPNSNTAAMQTSWGFVDEGALHVRAGNYFIRLQPNHGSFSGLGFDLVETTKHGLIKMALQPSLWTAIDVADIGWNGNKKDVRPFRLFRLNTETGDLE